MHDDSHHLLNYDFSQLSFGEYKANLKNLMAEFTKELKLFPNIMWDFQNFRYEFARLLGYVLPCKKIFVLTLSNF